MYKQIAFFFLETKYPNEPDYKNPIEYCDSLVPDGESDFDLSI